ncbi:MAG: phospholipid carrier-dependent glycosyltransferase, partial [Cyanobacteria bacterium J06648_11]
ILVILALLLAATFRQTAIAIAHSERNRFRPLVCGFYLALLVLMHSDLWVWELNEAYAVQPVAELVRSRTPQNAEIVTSFGYVRPSLDFYSERRVVPLAMENVGDRWQSGTYFLVENADALPAAEILGSAEGFALVTPVTPPQP